MTKLSKKYFHISILALLFVFVIGIYPENIIAASPYDVLASGGSLLGSDLVVPSGPPCDPIGGTADGCLKYGPVVDELSRINNKEKLSITFDSILNTIVLPALSSSAKIAARRLVNQITEKTVDWINGGFTDRPAYVSDPSKFISETANEAAGDVIQNSALGFLCEPFRDQVKISLVLNLPSYTNFKQQVTCTFTDFEKNALGAFDHPQDMWSAWLDISQNPQNSGIGAYLIAENQINNQVQKKVTNLLQDLTGGQGALSLKHCMKYTYTDGLPDDGVDLGTGFKDQSTIDIDPNTGDGVEIACDVTTPGAVITSTLGFQSTSDARMNELIGALGDGIDQILGALANQIIKNVENQITKGVLGNKATNNFHYNQNNSYLNTVDETNQAYYSNLQTQYQQQNQTGGTIGLTETQKNLVDAIDAEIKLESSRIANLNTALNTLTLAQKIFADAAACNYNYNLIPVAQQINSNAVTNIQGAPDSSRVVADFTWNLNTIPLSISSADANIQTLGNLKAETIATTSENTLTDISNQYEDKIFRKIFDVDALDSIKSTNASMLSSLEGSYTSNKCPINLTGII